MCALGIAAATVVASSGQAATEVRITAAGDYFASSGTEAVLDEIASINPDAHLALGDLAYGSRPDPYAWCDFVKERVGEGFPFQLVSGNHESNDNNDGDINDFSACLPNQIPGIIGTYGREYAMDMPRNNPLVRVIQASPNLTFENGRLTYSTGDDNYAWVSNAIDEGRAKGAQWIIVTSHYPCLTMGTNGCPATSDFYDLLVEKNVDLVLHGHEHSYGRTHQLASGVAGCPRIVVRATDFDCIADDDSAFGAGLGTVFATVGTGGIPLRDINPSDVEAGYFAAWSGANSQPAFGLLDLQLNETQLTANFVNVSGGGFTDSFTITDGLPPETTTTTTAAPTTTVPGTTTTIPTTTTTTTTAPATTTTTTLPPVASSFAADGFTRSIAAGWGAADVGGPWSSSSASVFSVAGDAGRIALPKGRGHQAYLSSVASTDTDLRLTMSVDKVTSGSGLYMSIIPRSVGSDSYRAVVRTQSSGRVSVRIDRGFSTISSAVTVAGITATAGTELNVRTQAIGANPTVVQVKVWEVGTPEPATWNRTITDNTAALQQAGYLGLYAYYSSSANNAPITISVDDLVATAP